MPGATGVAAKEYFIKIITALSLLHVQLLFGARFTENRQTPTKAILATKGCLSECHAILANDTKPKVQTGFSGCYLLCLKRAKDRQSLTGPATFQTMKNRIRKSIFQRNECQMPSPNQTLDWRPSKIEVNFGKYENTSNWFINVSWTPMNDVNETWSGILIGLSLEEKVDLSSDIYCALLPKNQTVHLNENISSYGYTYPDRIWLKVIGFPFVWDEGVIPSFAPPTPPIKTTATTTSSQASAPTDLTPVILPAVIGILIGSALVAGLIKYFLCHKRRLSLPEGFEYDAFIIYSQMDQLWISERLLPLLEERNEVKCCIHYRDFKPGKVFYDSMAECVYKSFKIIAVLSNNFFDSNYCSYELNIAKYRLLNARDDSLIMIRIDNVDREKLPRKLQKRSFIDYFNPLERPFWEKKLLKFLNAPNDDCIDKSAETSHISNSAYDNNN